VTAKEQAANAYNDALANGESAFIAGRQKTDEEETMTLMIGNLSPGQSAVIKIQMIALL